MEGVYGWRLGLVAGRFGHQWEIGRPPVFEPSWSVGSKVTKNPGKGTKEQQGQ
jgi:hypothetical protein